MGLGIEHMREYGLGLEAAHDRDGVRVPIPLLVLHEQLPVSRRLVRGRTAPALRLRHRCRRVGRRPLALRWQRRTLQRNGAPIKRKLYNLTYQNNNNNNNYYYYYVHSI